MKKGKRIVAANWKTNPGTLLRSKEIMLPLKRIAPRLQNVSLSIFPPAPFIAPLRSGYSGKKITFGAQDVSIQTSGSHTGEVSASMLASVGATSVIVGHSERRAGGETNEIVSQKLQTVLQGGLSAIVCIGERERDHGGKYLEFLQEELTAALRGVSAKSLRNIMIAYEPIFAIGKSAGDALSPHNIHETVLFIRRILTELYDRDSAFKVPILYGGSVEAVNAEEILKGGEVQGFLVGHASLSPDEFKEILTIANRV